MVGYNIMSLFFLIPQYINKYFIFNLKYLFSSPVGISLLCKNVEEHNENDGRIIRSDFCCNKCDLALASHQKKYNLTNSYQHLEIEYGQCLHEKFTYMKVYRTETRISQINWS